jgi:hypothetical protein
MTRKGPRRLEIEHRLALFQANRPRVIARELGVSIAWICEISKSVADARRAKGSKCNEQTTQKP